MAIPDRPSLSVTVPSSLTPGIPAATLNSAARSAGDASDSRSRSPTCTKSSAGPGGPPSIFLLLIIAASWAGSVGSFDRSTGPSTSPPGPNCSSEGGPTSGGAVFPSASHCCLSLAVGKVGSVSVSRIRPDPSWPIQISRRSLKFTQ